MVAIALTAGDPRPGRRSPPRLPGIVPLLATGVALGAPGALVIAALVLLVRPLGVWVAVRHSALGAADKVLIAWMGPRGIVAAAIATLAAETLEAQGLVGGPGNFRNYSIVCYS